MLDRFDAANPALALPESDTDTQAIVRLYQTYWWRALDQPGQRALHEAALLASLRTHLDLDEADAPDASAVEAAVKSRLGLNGYHALLGRTPPLRELMTWRQQDSRILNVDLPGGSETVRAELLDNFLSLGWAHYASCGKRYTGGWATQDALFAVMPAYDGGMQSEEFRVVFLSHEAQHFADKRRYAALEAWELEYRAKLVELALATELGPKRLSSMLSTQGDDPKIPHPYANRRVIEGLRRTLPQPLDAVPFERIKLAAIGLLEQDTRKRQSHTQRPAP